MAIQITRILDTRAAAAAAKPRHEVVKGGLEMALLRTALKICAPFADVDGLWHRYLIKEFIRGISGMPRFETSCQMEKS